MTHPHTPFVTKRASFAIKESLFFIKVGKVTFFCEKSLPCRYSALSLHLKTVGKWPISDSFSRSASTLPSLCLRSGFALASLPEAKKSTRQCGSRDKVQMLWHLRDSVGLRSPLRYRDNSLDCRFTSRSNKLTNSKRLTNYGMC